MTAYWSVLDYQIHLQERTCCPAPRVVQSQTSPGLPSCLTQGHATPQDAPYPVTESGGYVKACSSSNSEGPCWFRASQGAWLCPWLGSRGSSTFPSVPSCFLSLPQKVLTSWTFFNEHLATVSQPASLGTRFGTTSVLDQRSL